jgi:hypothetical protein
MEALAQNRAPIVFYPSQSASLIRNRGLGLLPGDAMRTSHDEYSVLIEIRIGG